MALLSLSLGSSGRRGTVGLVEEVDEEPEVGSEKERAEDGSVSSTMASIGDDAVLSQKQNSEAEVAETDVNDELDDLHGGQVLLPPGVDANRSHSVVPVHKHVDDKVEGDGDPLLARDKEDRGGKGRVNGDRHRRRQRVDG